MGVVAVATNPTGSREPLGACPVTRGRGGSRRRAAALCGLLMAVSLAACSKDAPTADPAASESTAAPTAIRYVSPTGLDTSPGTEDLPWQTLRHALGSLSRGEVLYVRGGDYHEELVEFRVRPGSQNQRILVVAYPGERPVVHGPVWLRRPSYWTIDGLNVTWDPALATARQQLVKITGGTGWVWQNSEIWGSRGSTNMFVAGYGDEEPARWSITGNCIHDVAPPETLIRSSNLAIGAMGAAGPGSITRNVIFSAPGPQNVLFGSATGGPSDVTFEYNTVHGGGAALTLAGSTDDVLITKNILGGVSSGLVVRWTNPQGSDSVVTQNLGVQATAFMRPVTEAAVGGPGNIIDPSLAFPDVTSCDGFQSDEPAALPYGAHAVG